VVVAPRDKRDEREARGRNQVTVRKRPGVAEVVDEGVEHVATIPRSR
jgi:hypothetical protein